MKDFFLRLFSWIFGRTVRITPLGIVMKEEDVFLLGSDKKGNLFFLPRRRGKKGFSNRGKLAIHIQDEDGNKEDGRTIEERVTLSHHDGLHVLTYVRVSEDKKVRTVRQAVSTDFYHYRILPLAKAPMAPGIAVPDYAFSGKAIMYSGLHGIHYATTEDYNSWSRYKEISVGSYKDSLDGSSITLLGVELISEGILVIYDDSHVISGNQTLAVGGMLFSYDDPRRLLWHSSEALFDPQRPSITLWEQFIQKTKQPGSYEPLGVSFEGEKMHVFYVHSKTKKTFSVELMQPFIGITVSEGHAHLDRFEDGKHLLHPDEHPEWGAVGTFNAAAVTLGDDVHLLYRAQGHYGLSVAGHTKSTDPHHFPNLKDGPVYLPSKTFEGVGLPAWMRTGAYASGYALSAYGSCAGWHGCEDPRLTRIDDRIYMVYAAYNGYEQARLAMTSISVSDFEAEKWNWDEPQVITRRPTVFGTGTKNGVLFPEKIKGKYVFLHRMWPNISIDYVDDLEFGEDTKWLIERDYIPPLHDRWDSGKIGAGAPPIKTKDGWLLIYQGVGSQDFNSHYKVGAMLLDLENPAKVLYRSTHPILEPATWYEKEGGHKPGVVYSCGAVVKDGMLYVYYGASDTTTCLAKAPLDKFLEDLKRDKFEDPVLQLERL